MLLTRTCRGRLFAQRSRKGTSRLQLENHGHEHVSAVNGENHGHEHVTAVNGENHGHEHVTAVNGENHGHEHVTAVNLGRKVIDEEKEFDKCKTNQIKG